MIINRQQRIRVPLGELAEFLAQTQRALHLPAGSLSVCLVTDAEIARWNRAYRHKRGPTDVLSFPVDAAPAGGARRMSRGRRRVRTRGPRENGFSAARNSGDTYLGDIAIAPRVAQRNARRLGRSFAAEMRILILHGMLHLLGYDHETDTGQMERREQRLRRKFGLT